MRKPTLFILTGPSGVGKATVSQGVFLRTTGIAKVVTYTTRHLRPGEDNHVTYHFISKEEFERKIRDGELFEWEKVYGDEYYGSPKDPFEHVPQGYDALLEIGVEGMKKYRDAFPDAVTVFLAPPSMDSILDRIAKRGGGESNLENRLQSAVEMIQEAEGFHYIVVNDRLEAAIEKLASIVIAERCRRRRKDVAALLQQQIQDWRKKRKL